jgi:predicted Zn-dependent protease
VLLGQYALIGSHGWFYAVGHVAQRPFAKIMLALAALRERKPDLARIQLNELVAEFPENPLFAGELAKLKVSPAPSMRPNIR